MLDYRARTFLEVCRQGSYTKAAQELRLSQPAVSQHIRDLETRYRARLFSDRGRRLTLTPAGEMLRQALATMANDEMELERRIASANGGPSALSFGATLTVGDYVAPACVAAHLAAHPQEQLTMTVANTRELLAGIDAGKLSFALIEGYFDPHRYEFLTFSHEPYIAVCAAGSALPDPPARMEDLFCETLLVREKGSGTREVLEKHLAARNLSLGRFATLCELGSIGAIKGAVQAGAGISFLYRTAVASELEAGALRDVTPLGINITHEFSFVWQRGSMYGSRWRAIFDEWRRAWEDAAEGQAAKPT